MELTESEVSVLKYGLRHGLLTQPKESDGLLTQPKESEMVVIVKDIITRWMLFLFLQMFL